MRVRCKPSFALSGLEYFGGLFALGWFVLALSGPVPHSRGSETTTPRYHGKPALLGAVYADDFQAAKSIVEAGADVNATNRYGAAPLSVACQNGNAEIVELLLKAGADPNTKLRGGETALMTAARTGKPGPVKALIAHGAEVNAKERRGQTALMWAAADGHAEVVELLLKAGADIYATLPDSGFNAFLFAAREGRPEVLRALLKAGADVNEPMQPQRPHGKGPRKGSTALILAIENGHFKLALDLIDAGADPNDQRSGFAPLHTMTWVRKPPRGEDEGAPPPQGSGNISSLQFIKKLVERGADVNARLKSGRGNRALYNKRGATPFLMASATADVAYMKLLLDLGADARIPNADNTTPLIAACGLVVGEAAANETAGEEAEVLEAAQLLLKAGVDINAIDDNGETAMHAAAYKNLPKVVQFLADNGAKIDIWNRTNKYSWTPLHIAEGYRPGNFKPSAETAAAIRVAMRSAGVIPPEKVNTPANWGPSYNTVPEPAAAKTSKTR